MKQIKCPCGKKFTPSKYVTRAKYCSRKCGRHFFHYNNLAEQRQNAKNWYEEHRESEIEKNREYRKLNKELFNWYHDKTRYNGLRNDVLKRDNNKCSICKGKKVSIHHIDGIGYHNGQPNNVMENLITLCPSCHHKLHWWQRKNIKLTSSEDIVRTMAKVIEAGSKSLR